MGVEGEGGERRGSHQRRRYLRLRMEYLAGRVGAHVRSVRDGR
jgi:hypothetical protein